MSFHAAVATLNNAVANFPAVSAGDLAMALVCTDGATTGPTPPAGWTQRVNMDLSGPDGGFYRIFDKDTACTGSETTATFGLGTGVSQSIVIIATDSGRNAAAPRTFVGTPTQDTNANTVPIAVSATGGTAVAGDDLFFFVGFDPTSATAGLYTLSSVTAGFVKAVESSTSWLSAALWYKDAASAGATGSVSGTAGGGSATAGYAAAVIAYAAAPAAAQQPSLFFGSGTTG